MKNNRFGIGWSGMIAVLAGLLAWDVNAQKEFSPPLKFDGTATPIITTTIKFGYNDAFRGIITYVARPGTIVRGAVYDLDGHVIDPGDVLIHMETDYRQSVVDGKKATVKSTEANLKNAKDNYARYKTLMKTDATSVQQFQQSEADYYAALGSKEAAEADLKLAEVMLEACTFRAPFDAVVEKVFFPAGLCAGELDVVRIAQLAPMGIHVKMPRELARKIDNTTPVKVYPCNSDQPVGIMHGHGFLTDDGMIFSVDNYSLPPPVSLKDGDRTIPICRITEVFPLSPRDLQRSRTCLVIREDSIYTDAKGNYVWRALGQLNMDPDRGINHIFPVEKVYITPDKYVFTVNSYAKYRFVALGGVLNPHEVLLRGEVPATLKTGDKVCSFKAYYLFMPGDPVKVVIGK